MTMMYSLTPKHPASRLLCRLALPLLLMLLAHDAHAQFADHRGRHFWVAFLPSNGSDGPLEAPDLRMCLIATRPTMVTITFTKTGQQRTFPVAAYADTSVSLLSFFEGAAELSDDGDAFASGGVSSSTFEVTADDDITVVGLTVRMRSADAFLALAEPALTGSYMVLAYPSGLVGSLQGPGGFDMPSEFAVVASADSTIVTINPPVGVRLNAKNGPIVARLDRGQVLLAQAELSSTAATDVSGTEILANHRIAVFAGCKRTSVPTAVGNFRDFVVEQLPPIAALTSEVYVTPFMPYDAMPTTRSEVRVVAPTAGTTLSIHGPGGSVRDTVLSNHLPLTIPFDSAMTITASAPILAAQFAHSGDKPDNQGLSVGDPFMALATGRSQFLDDYEFLCPKSSAFTADLHYINVVKPTGQNFVLMLDSQAVTADYTPIPGAPLEYARIRVAPGTHHARANMPFGLTVYGYGPLTSYGYVAGMQMPNVSSGVRGTYERDSAGSAAIAVNVTRRSDGALDVAVQFTEGERAMIDLLDTRGITVRRMGESTVGTGTWCHTVIPVDGLASGAYLLRVVVGTRVFVRKVAVLR